MKYKITYIHPFLEKDFQDDFIINKTKESLTKFNFKFRLFDADRNIYFEGVATRNDSFDPLDFLGTEYSCTDLQFFENGKFVSL